MKAAVFHAPGDLRLETVAEFPSADGDLVIKMRSAAICGTDIRIFRGRKTRGVRKPSVLGHEFVGEIVSTGGHRGWSRGDMVAVCPALPCGTCRECRLGAENICANLVAFGYEIDGGFAEFVRIPAAFVAAGHVFPIPGELTPDCATLAEPLACVINGQDRLDFSPGDTVAVLGTGPIGLLHIMLARLNGAGRVIAVQRSEHRRAAALSIGADQAVSAEEAEQLKADATIVAVGSAELAGLAFRITRPRGKINLFAGFPVNEPIAIDVNALHYGEHTVTGAFGLTRTQFGEALDLLASGLVPATNLISHRLPLNRVMEAFQLAEQGSALKVVVTTS